DICFTIEEKTQRNKVVSLVFNIYTIDKFKKLDKKNIITKKEEENLFTDSLDIEFIDKSENTKVVNSVKSSKIIEIKEEKSYNDKVKRIVSFFDLERKKLQPNYIRKEYGNKDAEYQLRIHLKETQRTPEMFYDAIRWLFSNNPKASFHRQHIMNIGKLIEHFNTLEHQAMYSKEAIKFSEETQIWYNVYKKQGLEEDEILQKLREGGYIK
ncbi:MAG: hypothetical protein J7L21_04075, partial [Sulfurimonas sp.]|nr:hypothetical protein [Sulfurimonas sp.]